MPTDTESPPLHSWDLADPVLLIEQISRLHPLTIGVVLLALVRHPSTTQELVRVERFPIDCREPVPDDLSKRLCDAVDHFPLPAESHPILHTVATVIIRSGFTVPGQTELDWTLGWRYSNHLRPVFTSQLMLVTEHGWFDLITGWGGHEPRMVDHAQERHILESSDAYTRGRWPDDQTTDRSG